MNAERVELQLKKMFQDVHSMNGLLGRLNKLATLLREISVNSAIAAGHVGTEAGALNEIANQIGKLSTQLSEAVTEAHSGTSKVSNYILNCVVDAGAYKKMVESLEIIGNRTCDSTQSIESAVQSIINNKSEQLAKAQDELEKLTPSMNQIQQVSRRIWSIILSLRISSGIAGEESGSFFLSIAQSLDEMVTDCSRSTHQMFQLIHFVSETLTQMSQEESQGEPYAA